jgi:hypothetical protein
MTTTPRPGSRKATVYTKYCTEGYDAAVNCGFELKLAANTVKSWINVWSKANGKDAPAPPAKKLGRMVSKSAVTVKWWPEREAYLIEKGPEQSEIRWADTGVYACVSTSDLKE